METFLGLNFVPFEISHQKNYDDLLKRSPPELAVYAFGGLIAWNEVYFYEWVRLSQETLLISVTSKDGRRHLLQPLGEFPAECQADLLQRIGQLPYPLKIFCVSERFIEKHGAFCSKFQDNNEAGLANYFYLANDLAMLAGRRYAKKRNLIAQAESLYQWTTQPLTPEHKSDCLRILKEIQADKEIEMTDGLQEERKALNFMISHFHEINQRGCIIYVKGAPAAFAIYEELNPTTAVVHFEKAERRYKGLYQLINRETAKAIVKGGYEFINREEDLNVAGLRQAKLSYFPIHLTAAHTRIFLNK